MPSEGRHPRKNKPRNYDNLKLLSHRGSVASVELLSQLKWFLLGIAFYSVSIYCHVSNWICAFLRPKVCDANLDIDFLPEDASKISERPALRKWKCWQWKSGETLLLSSPRDWSSPADTPARNFPPGWWEEPCLVWKYPQSCRWDADVLVSSTSPWCCSGRPWIRSLPWQST